MLISLMETKHTRAARDSDREIQFAFLIAADVRSEQWGEHQCWDNHCQIKVWEGYADFQGHWSFQDTVGQTNICILWIWPWSCWNTHTPVQYEQRLVYLETFIEIYRNFLFLSVYVWYKLKNIRGVKIHTINWWNAVSAIWAPKFLSVFQMNLFSARDIFSPQRRHNRVFKSRWRAAPQLEFT